jgi:hypothetical protein
MEYLSSSRTLRKLCGWERAAEMPSEATFSRAFSEFAKDCHHRFRRVSMTPVEKGT